MLILANTGWEASFEVSRVNGRVFLTGEQEGVVHRGSEWNAPCSYYVVESSAGVIEMDKGVEAKVVVFETVYETGVAHEKEDFMGLLSSFGNAKSREAMKSREVMGAPKRIPAHKTNAKVQILPPSNEEAEGPEERFVMEKMFPKEVLEEFSKINIGSVLLHPDLMSLRRDMDYKIHFLLADCIVKLMEKRYVTGDCLDDSGYSSFFAVIKDDIENKKLTPLGRDKLAVLCYILILQIERFSLKYELLPDFKLPKEKVIKMFRMIGCSYNPLSGVIRASRKAGATRG